MHKKIIAILIILFNVSLHTSCRIVVFPEKLPSFYLDINQKTNNNEKTSDNETNEKIPPYKSLYRHKAKTIMTLWLDFQHRYIVLILPSNDLC